MVCRFPKRAILVADGSKAQKKAGNKDWIEDVLPPLSNHAIFRSAHGIRRSLFVARQMSAHQAWRPLAGRIAQKAVLSKMLERTAKNQVIFEAGAKKEKSRNPYGYWIFRWRRVWDSNPRALADNRISSAARYDHFDTLPYPIM